MLTKPSRISNWLAITSSRPDKRKNVMSTNKMGMLRMKPLLIPLVIRDREKPIQPKNKPNCRKKLKPGLPLIYSGTYKTLLILVLRNATLLPLQHKTKFKKGEKASKARDNIKIRKMLHQRKGEQTIKKISLLAKKTLPIEEEKQTEPRNPSRVALQLLR
jgi:hypothetical protein